jgi:hypothetical protein
MRASTQVLKKSVLLSILGMLGCGSSASTAASQGGAKQRTDDKPATAEPTAKDVDLAVLDGVEPLRAMFNADADKLRVIALLEPG